MLHIVGNGPSRLKHDIDNLGEWWGCNAIQYDHSPDILFSVDVNWHEEVISSGYYKENKVAVASWDPIDISMWSMIVDTFKMEGQRITEIKNDDDTHFIVQGNGYYISVLGYDSKYDSNLIRYNYPELKNLFSGMSALGYACISGYKDITLLGFDSLQYDNPSNVYEGRLSKYLPKYTKEDRVNTAQKSQFIALLERFDDVNFYFKNDVGDLELIKYDELPYYEERERWYLGEGLESDTLRYNANTIN